MLDQRLLESLARSTSRPPPARRTVFDAGRQPRFFPPFFFVAADAGEWMTHKPQPSTNTIATVQGHDEVLISGGKWRSSTLSVLELRQSHRKLNRQCAQSKDE